MKYIILGLLGLCFGSFINALVWRLHEQGLTKGKKTKKNRELSILRGRSMCVHCKHTLGGSDLIPVLSWVVLGGRCRYCKKPISWQYPLVELLTAAALIASYIFWPEPVVGHEWLLFGLWLPILIGLIALTIYDLRWYLLPNVILLPVAVMVALQAVLRAVLDWTSFGENIAGPILGISVGGGIFYVLYRASREKWIGGGDVKLGAVLGLLVASPLHAGLVLFGSSVLGSAVSLPLLATGKVKKNSHIPYGPFLIIAAVIVYFAGSAFVEWYKRTFLVFTP